jgi:hypothetical protein
MLRFVNIILRNCMLVQWYINSMHIKILFEPSLLGLGNAFGHMTFGYSLMDRGMTFRDTDARHDQKSMNHAYIYILITLSDWPQILNSYANLCEA